MTRRTKLAYNDKTGMFEESPVVGRRFAGLLRVVSWPVGMVWRLLCRIAGLSRRLLLWFFYPVIRWWSVIRRDYRNGDYILVALWLLLGYFMFLLYRSVILWFCEVGWLLLAAVAVCLWRELVAVCLRMWDFISSLVAMTANTIPWR